MSSNSSNQAIEPISDEKPLSSKPEPKPSDAYPDGGLRAWIIVSGAVCVAMSSFGYVNAWGAFQEYYQLNILRDSSPSMISWIGSIQYCLAWFPGLFIGRLFDIGYFHIPFLVSSIILVVATFLIAECTKYWHFVLCQGIASGLATGCIFAPTLTVVAHWFKVRRSFAYGVTAVGTSIGGTIFPIMFRNLVPQVGFRWSMRIIGFILLFTLSIANLTLRRRLPPMKAGGGLFNLAAFKSPAYSIYCLSAFFGFLGIYTLLIYIDISAVSSGVDADFAFYLVAIANAASIVGRILSGLLADRVGAMNVLIPSTIITGVLTYIWPFVHGVAAYVIIAIFYGITSGVFIALLFLPVAAMGQISDMGRRQGMLCTLMALGALGGPPVSGAIRNASNSFNDVGVYAGTTIMICMLLMCLTRWAALDGKIIGKF